MDLNILSAFKGKLDDPFHDKPASVSVPHLSCVVPTPIGDELIDPTELDEKTVVMSAETVKKLLWECSEKRTTVVEMRAVKVA